jgi:hypothetical protein
MVELITCSALSLPLPRCTTHPSPFQRAASSKPRPSGLQWQYAIKVQSALNAIADPAAAAEADRQLRGRLQRFERQAVQGPGRLVRTASTTTAAVLKQMMVLTVRAVEVEDADEAETPSSQHYKFSRSKAAVLLIRAGAKVEDGALEVLQELALGEGNEELRELLSSCAASPGPSKHAEARQSSYTSGGSHLARLAMRCEHD